MYIYVCFCMCVFFILLTEKMAKSKLTCPLSLLTLLLLQLSSLVSSESQVPCFFVFGDSTVDNGNNNDRETTSKADYLPYGIDFPDGPTGRFTNGRNIADVIAELLGFEKLIPPFVNATNEDILRGVNYGSGGAGILDHTGRAVFGDVISMNKQLSNHESAILRTSLSEKHLRKCIYYVSIGNNDYLVEYIPKFFSTGTQYSPKQYASLLIRRYSKQLQRLYDDGARKVAVSGLGSLGCVPQQVATYGSFERDETLCIKTSNEIVSFFDEKLKILVRDLNRQLPGAKFVLIASDASSFGNITNLSDPCCGTEIGNGNTKCLPSTIPCSNRDEYLFWDEVHPSEATYLIYGQNAYDKMSRLLGDDEDAPIDVM